MIQVHEGACIPPLRCGGVENFDFISMDKLILNEMLNSSSEVRSKKCYIEVIPSTTKSDSPNSFFGLNASEITAIGSLGAVIVSIFLTTHTVIKYSRDYKMQQKSHDKELADSRIRFAKEKIENFFGPCKALLEESATIYEFFALREKKEHRENGNYFRTLRFLTEKTHNGLKGASKLTEYDQKLLDQIVEISIKVRVLIEEKSGYVDNPSLHSLLGKLSAHYRTLSLAHQGGLDGLSKELEDIVFPLEINGAIESEINRLLDIISGIERNELPANNTVSFYNKNHLEYYYKTHELDMKEVYDKVRKYVKNGSHILDAGCGTGRDTRYFIQHGFKVVSFDASARMVELCNEYPFSYCINETLESIKLPPKFDLVWACASLLHLNKDKMISAGHNLHRALKPGGYIYFSLKKIKPLHNDGRDFYIYSDEEIKRIFEEKLKLKYIESWESVSEKNDSDIFLSYVYQKIGYSDSDFI